MAKKTLEVKVTQKHIDKADQAETNTCAIALALAEQFDLNIKEVKSRAMKSSSAYDDGEDEGLDGVYVTPDEIRVRKTNGFSFNFTWHNIPKKVESFIEKFDDDRKRVKPFSFRLPFFGE